MADATYTSEQYAIDFLHQIGNSAPAGGTVLFVEEWIKHESKAPGGAAFNPLNTTQQEPGSTFFNFLNPQHTFGVQNFTSYQQGVAANAQVLENGYYPSLLAALRNNDLAALGVFSGQESSGVAANLKTWGTGAFPVTGLASANQTFVVSPFTGGGGNVPPSTQAAANTSVPAPAAASSTAAPLQLNASTLILLGVAVVIIIVAAGSMKARQVGQAEPIGGQSSAVRSV